MTGERQLPALLRAFAGTEDQMTMTKVTTIKEGYMLITDFENCMERATVKIFPTESAAKASGGNERILKVKVEREL